MSAEYQWDPIYSKMVMTALKVVSCLDSGALPSAKYSQVSRHTPVPPNNPQIVNEYFHPRFPGWWWWQPNNCGDSMECIKVDELFC